MSTFARTIFHVDMDAFFVSVEELFAPELKGKAVVVGGQRDERGVVSAASYEARKFGVHSALPLRTAYKLCPHAIFVPGHPERYREYSGRVFEILKRFSPLVEMASVDEAYLDRFLNTNLKGTYFTTQAIIPQMLKQHGGVVITVKSLPSRAPGVMEGPTGRTATPPAGGPVPVESRNNRRST